jgi:hypothetical protein
MADDVKPIVPRDDFSDDEISQSDLNPIDSNLLEGLGDDALASSDESDDTLTPDEPTDNPLDTASGMDEDELDSDVNGKEKIGDTVNS